MAAHAAPVAYTGANNGDWFTATNWDSQQVPTADDDVMIGEGKTVKALACGTFRYVTPQGVVLIVR